MKYALFFLLCSFPILTLADSWPVLKTVTGQEFEEASLIKVEPDGIRILHASGVAKIACEDLPDELRQAYGFDAAQAAEFRAASGEKQRQALREGEILRQRLYARERETARLQALTYHPLCVEVLRVLPGGMLCVPCHGRSSWTTFVVTPAALSEGIPVPVASIATVYWVTGAGEDWAEGDLLHTLAARGGAQEIEGRMLPWLVCKER